MASAGALALTVAAGSATVAVGQLEDNVTRIDISEQVGERPVDYGDLSEGPVTFLLMGSDQRTGKGNKGYGNFEGARSDTTMLLHIYPDRESAVVVSIPRDTIVDLPSCKNADGRVLPATRDRFNAAFDRGGPGCTVKTVEAMTGLTVDHFVVLDFNGFKKTIDALGGVEVCLTRPLQDSKSGVDLPAGRTRVSGEEALSFVRVRHNIGDGSDISRINRQQIFLSSLIQEVTGSGLLTDPLRVWRVLSESSKSIATDKALADSDGLLALAASVSGLRPKDISFVTLPVAAQRRRGDDRGRPAQGGRDLGGAGRREALAAAAHQGRGRREAHRDPRPDPRRRAQRDRRRRPGLPGGRGPGRPGLPDRRHRRPARRWRAGRPSGTPPTSSRRPGPCRRPSPDRSCARTPSGARAWT